HGRFLPAFERNVNRLDPGLRCLARRQVIDFLAVQLVADADLQFFETVEDIELGQRYAGDSVRRDGLAHKSSVEPSAATLAARDGAELTPLLAQQLADFVV